MDEAALAEPMAAAKFVDAYLESGTVKVTASWAGPEQVTAGVLREYFEAQGFGVWSVAAGQVYFLCSVLDAGLFAWCSPKSSAVVLTWYSNML